MGHAHHFLSRLDRVAPAQVELALALYNDVPLLRYVLDHSRVPDAAERVALSIDHPDDGPFLLVTREGRFVTCLAKGMRASDVPVVPRSQLDALAAHCTDLRERMALAGQLSGGTDAGQLRFFKRIFTAGADLSREEFVALSAFTPLLEREWLGGLFRLVSDLADVRPALLRARPGAALDDARRSYWNQFWAVGHLTLLTAHRGPALLDAVPADIRDELAARFGWGASRQGISALSLRAAWGVARLGKALLPGHKAALRESRTTAQLVTAALGFTALGLRHSKLRAEVRKTLEASTAAHAFGESDVARAQADFFAALTNLIRESGTSVLQSPDEWSARHLDMGRALCVRRARHARPGSPLRFERPEDVPEDLARTLSVNHLASYFTDTEAIVHMFGCLPWVANAEPEEFYFPRVAVRDLGVHYTPEFAQHLLDSMEAQYGKARGEPVRVAKLPGRNDPCHCGSGTKFKRCHGVGVIHWAR